MPLSSLDPWQMLDLVDVAVIVHDANAVIVYANQAAGALLGTGKDELVTRSSHSPWDIVDAEGKPLAPEGQPAVIALQTGKPVKGVLLGVARPSAPRVWLIVSAIPIGEGAERRAVVNFTDATAERARFELAESSRASLELRFEASLRAMTEGLVVHDANGAIRFCNPGAERILGLTRDQLLGRAAVDPRWRLVRPDGQPATTADIPSEITTRTGRAVHGAILGVERGDGTRAWLSVSSDCLAGQGDASQGIVATFTDITELREAQLSQERSAAQLRAITQATPGLIYRFLITDEGERRVPFVAGRVRELFGVSEDEIRADPELVIQRIPTEDREVLTAASLRSRAELTLFDQQLRLVDRERTRWLRARAHPVRVPGGTVWTGVALDVTEEKMLAEGLRRSQVRQAMGDLAAGIAHNFNNMLAVILPNVEGARAVSAEVEPLLADVSAATQRAAELVKQILYVVRGQGAGPREDVDLVRVVGHVVELCRRTFDRSIVLDVAPLPARALIRGNVSHVEQVLLNLCLNARDALHDVASPRLRLELVTVAGQHRLVVQDNGAGMTEETLQRLGELFFTTKAPGKGTGLGLATAFGTMRDLGGRIEVKSTLGQGARFELWFPAVSESVALPASADEATAGRSLRLLLVDDEDLVRRAIVRLLTRRGHQVVEAADGTQALALVQADPALEAVVLDLSMPGLSGVETLRRLRASRPTLPVILATGDASPRPGFELANEVLEKPLPEAALLEALARVTSASK